jgi:hypothetical protein
MVQLIKQPKVSVITKNGECEISISLDININVTEIKTAIREDESENKNEPNKPSESLIIPQFTKEKIKFGKKVEE